MKPIKVKYINQGHVERAQSRVRQILESEYTQIIDEKSPDYVIVGPHQTNSLAPWQDKILIFETCEAVVPDFNLVDYAISFENLTFGDRHFRMPMSLAQWKAPSFSALKTPEEYYNRDFCNFLYSNPKAHPIRDQFFQYLNDNYKKVDSLGRHLNNISQKQQMYWENWALKEDSKRQMQSRYKFTLAFENASHPGYVSEKIMHAFDADSIPIYWGDPCVDDWFNPESFVWVKDQADFPRALEQIKQLDGDPDAYMTMLKQPRLIIDLEHKLQEEDAFIRNIFDQDLESARRRGQGTFHDFYLRLHNEAYIRRWYRPGLIRKSQIWHSLHKITRLLGLYKVLRPLGKNLRKTFHK